MDNAISTGLRFYQSANADADEIKSGFIIRQREYGLIMDDIRNNPMSGSVQHYLLLGRRGSGKSTLLRRLQVEVDTDEALKASFVAINLAEEQANIYRLYDLLDEIIDALESKGVAVSRPAWTAAADESEYSRAAFAAIHGALAASGKKIILLLDNIDRILENLQEDAGILREILLNYSDLKIIGGSTRMTEHFWKYNQPFYQFFRVLSLERLSSEEMKNLLVFWSERLQLDVLKDFIIERPGQLEMVRLLTDGLPRTLQFFVNILISHAQETGYDYLRLVMDRVTPLYQERLNSLPAAQRRIVLQLAFLWEASGTKEIAAAVKMEPRVISAQLKQLAEKGIVDKIGTGTKNHLYRLSERFFNLWLIFTQGSPKEKRKARYLTIFLENFYSEEELRARAEAHLRSLGESGLSPDKAAIMTKAFAQSQFISTALRDELINRTNLLVGIDDELKKEMPLTTNNIARQIKALTKTCQHIKALELASTIEQEDGMREYFIGSICVDQENIEQAEQCFLQCISKGMNAGALMLAALYIYKKQYSNAEKYSKLALENGFQDALQLAGHVYYELGNTDSAKYYYLKAIEYMDDDPLVRLNLGNIFYTQGNLKLAERHWIIGAENGQSDAMYYLGIIYQDTNSKEAKKYLLQAYSKKHKQSAIALANLYYREGVNMDDAFEIVKGLNDTHETEQVLALRIVLNAWKGDLSSTTENLITLIRNGTAEISIRVMTHLLIHHQVNLLNHLFDNQALELDLATRFTPLFYVAKILAQNETNIQMKIPPELKSTVDSIIQFISKGRKFYYREELAAMNK